MVVKSVIGIIDHFEKGETDMQLLKTIVDHYDVYPPYIIKYILVYYAKSSSLCVLDHIINSTKQKQDCGLMIHILNTHDIMLCNESIIKHIACKNYTGCICKSRNYWYHMYKYFIRYVRSNINAFFNIHINRSLSTLLLRTDVYDNNITEVLETLSLDPTNWTNILRFIKDTELYGKNVGNIIFKLRDLIIQNSNTYTKGQYASIFMNQVLLGNIIRSYKQIHKNISKITDNIYISDITIPKNVPIIKDKNINCIVSLTKKNIFKISNIEYIHIAIDDIGTVNFIEATLETSKKIINYIDNNKIILVHCFKGLSRSVCFVILVLINKGMTFDEAYQYIKDRKIPIDPNPEFIDQLTEYYNIMLTNKPI